MKNKEIIFTICTFIIFLLLIFVFDIKVGLFEQPEVKEENISSYTSSYEEIVFNDIQEWRVSQGKDKFIVDELLCKYAEIRSKDIIDDWSHDQFTTRVSSLRSKKEYGTVGENLSKDFQNPKSVLPAWLNSKTHRDNLENNYKYACLKCTGTFCANWFGKEK